MNDNVSFSIITVTYNDLSNLQKTTQSVIDQRFKKYEWIIIDGGSTDGTVDFLRSIEKTIPSVQWISELDSGLYDAMNKGLGLCQLDYIIFMNAGDTFVDENTLYTINDHIVLAHMPDFIYGDAIELSPSRESFYRPSRSESIKYIGMFTHHQSMVYQRNIIVNYCLQYDTAYKIAADYKFTCEFLEKAQTLHYIPQPLSIFLQGGISQIQWKDSMKEQILIKHEILKMPYSKIYLIYLAQIGWHLIKEHLPWLYHQLRFRKSTNGQK